MKVQNNKKKIKRTFWMVAAFYGLIAFEFFYMASPFAVYFYSSYQPGLNFLNDIPGLGWVTSFFLPHIVVETSSSLINIMHDTGMFIFILGIISFLVSAIQVYYKKLTKKGAAIGGLYKFIRHPQYVSFAICGFGLLLLWPRFLVLIMFIMILFAYYFLAKIEERECEQKFGQTYINYKNTTSMFLPFGFGIFSKIFKKMELVFGRIFSIILVFALVTFVSLGLAKALQILSINSLYVFQDNHSVYLSIGKMEKEKFEKITSIVLNDSSVQDIFSSSKYSTSYFLNYVVPSDFYVSEIPMHIEETRQSSGHYLPADFKNINKFKLIFTLIKIKEKSRFIDKSFFRTNIAKQPVVEIWIDLKNNQVTDIKNLSQLTRYENIPMPLF